MRTTTKVLLLSFAIALISCSSSSDSGTPSPTITGIQPESGPPGTTVTISGKGFQPHAADFKVTIDGTTASVLSATKTEIQAEIPEGASSGELEVTIGDQTASGPSFTVEEQAPGISSVEPDSGVVGTKVTIKGMNFSATKSEISIMFNGTEAEIHSASETQLETEVPEFATDGPIEVTVKNKTTTGPDFEMLDPKITSVSPDTAVAGATIMIAGQNFSKKPAVNSLTIGGIQATVDSTGPDTLYTTIPAAAREGTISVIAGEQAGQAEFELVTTISACYGSDLVLDAQLQWVSQGLTTTKENIARDMARDPDGNIYIFDLKQGLVGKYDSGGNELWRKDVSGDIPNAEWRAIASDGQKIYIFGERGADSDGNNFGIPTLENHFSALKNNNPNDGARDLVLAQLDAGQGSIGWASQFGSNDLDDAEDVAILSSGKVVVTGKTRGPLTPSNSEPETSPDTYLAKFEGDKIGQVKQFKWRIGKGLNIDEQGRIYLASHNENGTMLTRFSSDLSSEISHANVARRMMAPVFTSDGGAFVYGDTRTSMEQGVSVNRRDAYVQRIDGSGSEVWAKHGKFPSGGSTAYIDGVALPGGGIALTGNDASEIGGLPTLGIYSDDGKRLLMDQESFFEFEADGKGSGWPSAITAIQDSDGDVHLVVLGNTQASWPLRSDDDENDPTGEQDQWMADMELVCTQKVEK